MSEETVEVTKPAAKSSKAKSKAKSKSKPAAKAKSKSKPAAKKSNEREYAPVADFGRAEEYGRKIAKEYGPVTVIRAISQKYPKLVRKDVLHLADKLKISRGTANTQFWVQRSGQVEVDLNAL